MDSSAGISVHGDRERPTDSNWREISGKVIWRKLAVLAATGGTEIESWILIASRAFKHGYTPCIIYPRRFLAMTVSLKLTPIESSICPRLLSPLRIIFGALSLLHAQGSLLSLAASRCTFISPASSSKAVARRRGDCSRKGQVVNSPFNRVSRFRGVESLSFQRLPLIKISLK